MDHNINAERLRGLDLSRERLPPRQEILYVFGGVIFFIYTWAIRGFLNQLPSLRLYHTLGEIFGVFSYLMAFAMMESLLTMAPFSRFVEPLTRLAGQTFESHSPNVILLVFDAWSANHVQLYGYPRLYPPHDQYRPIRNFYNSFNDGWKPLNKPVHRLSWGKLSYSRMSRLNRGTSHR